jgi:hypothetical protein
LALGGNLGQGPNHEAFLDDLCRKTSFQEQDPRPFGEQIEEVRVEAG